MSLVLDVTGKIMSCRRFEKNNEVKFFASIVCKDDDGKETVIPFVSTRDLGRSSDETSIRLKVGSYKRAEPFKDRATGEQRASLKDIVTFDLVH